MAAILPDVRPDRRQLRHLVAQRPGVVADERLTAVTTAGRPAFDHLIDALRGHEGALVARVAGLAAVAAARRRPRRPALGVDESIAPEIDNGAKAIAQKIANSPRFLDAIKRGLANKPAPGVKGPSYAQIIAKEVKAAMDAD